MSAESASLEALVAQLLVAHEGPQFIDGPGDMRCQCGHNCDNGPNTEDLMAEDCQHHPDRGECDPLEATMKISDFPKSYKLKMIRAYPTIAQMDADEEYFATAEERDEAFGRILGNQNLRRTHEMFLAEQAEQP